MSYWSRLTKVIAIFLTVSPLLLLTFSQTRWVPMGQYFSIKHRLQHGSTNYCGTCEAWDVYPYSIFPQKNTVQSKLDEIDNHSNSIYDIFSKYENAVTQFPNEKLFLAGAIRQGLYILRDFEAAKEIDAKEYALRIINFCRTATKKEPNNGFYQLALAISYQTLQNLPLRNKALQNAVNCSDFNDYSYQHSQERANLIATYYGYRGEECSEIDKSVSNPGSSTYAVKNLITKFMELGEMNLLTRFMFAKLVTKIAADSKWDFELRGAASTFLCLALNKAKLSNQLSNQARLIALKTFAKELSKIDHQFDLYQASIIFAAIPERLPVPYFSGTWEKTYESAKIATVLPFALLLLVAANLLKYCPFPHLFPISLPALTALWISIWNLLLNPINFEFNIAAVIIFSIALVISLIPNFSKFSIWFGIIGSVFIFVLSFCFDSLGNELFSSSAFVILTGRYFWTQKFAVKKNTNWFPTATACLAVLMLSESIRYSLPKVAIYFAFCTILVGLLCSDWQRVQLRDSYSRITRTWPILLSFSAIVYLISIKPIYSDNTKLREHINQTSVISNEIRTELNQLSRK